MKKQILDLGELLSKEEQKNVFGGNTFTYYHEDECGPDFPCGYGQKCISGKCEIDWEPGFEDLTP